MNDTTELRQLADTLDTDAGLAERLAGCPTAQSTDWRAAAVALRHHATLLDAIGDLSGGWTVLGGNRILDRIAAAVSPPPAPTTPATTPISDGLEQARASARALPAALQDAVRRSGTRDTAPRTTCPTCRSDDPDICRLASRDPHPHGLTMCCPDPWHQAADR